MPGRSGQRLVVQPVSLVDEPRETTAQPGTIDEIEEYLWNVLRSSTEIRRIDVECDKCPGYKHRVEVTIAGGKDGIAAAKELLDRKKGKAVAPKAPPEPVKVTGRLEDLTDEELEQLLSQESGE